jgi:hypothetical protein
VRSDAPQLVVGVDFDNTIVSYDGVMRRVASEQGVIAAATHQGKREIRDQVRQSPQGELGWQRLQSVVYGRAIGEAQLIDGVEQFFVRCRISGIATSIVSHKTEYAAQDQTHTNLREAALSWMREHQFFSPSGLGLSERSVYFESTRAEKIARILTLGCTHFIDDLEETFHEPMFPRQVEKLLYVPDAVSRAVAPGIKLMSNWQEIETYVFGADH